MTAEALPQDGATPTTHRALLGDARDLSRIADESAHLVVTSPPYPMVEMWDEQFSALDAGIADALSAGNGKLAHESMHRQLDLVWAEVFRVLVPGGIACINIGDATRTLHGEFQIHMNHSRILTAFMGLGFRSLPLILWRKQTNAPNKFMGSGMLPFGAYVTLEHEYILVLRKGLRRRFDDQEAQRRRRGAYFWEERNVWFSDIWDLKGARQSRAASPGNGRPRSGAFPLEIPFRLVSMYSLPGDTVLDPFAGTGTTLLAAMACGRNSMGMEIDADLLEESVARLHGSGRQVNDRILARLQAHREFVEARTADGRPPAHYNRFHGFPVVTAQETDMQVFCVSALEQVGHELRATHTPALAGVPIRSLPGRPEQPELEF